MLSGLKSPVIGQRFPADVTCSCLYD